MLNFIWILFLFFFVGNEFEEGGWFGIVFGILKFEFNYKKNYKLGFVVNYLL